MRQRDYVAKMNGRIRRAEAECHATIMRAFNRVLTVLEREKTEYIVYKTRQNARKPKSEAGS